ncbi:MAG TPA: serine hydrolase domain-containing protein [Kribbella sp.]|nr:serine hydrolase domain-containing protein [Kribbella sp.]
MSEIHELDLKATVAEVLNRWPTAGLAAGVVRGGSLVWFHGHGVADVGTGTPIDQDTVFRIGSITKTFTAIAVMQLWEQGLVDLDAPANDYLRGYSLVPAKAGFRPATLRHLLTHTAGVRAVRRPSDLLHPTLGWGARVGGPAVSLAEYYRGGLRVDFEPGSRWAYSNHGFATLGQIVEDVSGTPLVRYLRERVFGPLGMESTDLVRSERVRPRLATGYALSSGGLKAVADREIVVAGAGSVYSTTSDMARYVSALLGGGANEHGSVLRPETLALMFEPHYRPDPRVPGMGLAFLRDEVGGHRTVGHDGVWKGFLSDMTLAPDDGIGVLAFANTGGFDRRGAPVPVSSALLRRNLGVPADVMRTDVPEHPWSWGDLCGWYSLGPGVLTDPQPRAFLGGGVEVVVHHGQLRIRGQAPIPAVRKGLRLHPDGDDADAFRIDLSGFGLGTSPVVFGRGPDGEVTALYLGLGPTSFQKRPDARNSRPWVNGALVAGATAIAVRRRRTQRPQHRTT